jgi:hypothetical protein
VREISDLTERLSEQVKLREMMDAKDRALDAALEGNSKSLIDGSWVDYGERNDYETLKNVCVESEPQGGYKYSLCHYKKITQVAVGKDENGNLDGTFSDDVITLGYFSHWGPWLDELASHGGSESDFHQQHSAAVGAVLREKHEMGKRGLLNALSFRMGTAISNLAGVSSLKDRRETALSTLHSTPGYFTHSVYDRGEPCVSVGGNIERSVQVTFRCGATDTFERMVESETCKYDAIIATPLACTHEVEASSLDTLDRLGVFGFTRSTSEEGVRSGSGSGSNNRLTLEERNEELRNVREESIITKQKQAAEKAAIDKKRTTEADARLLKKRADAATASEDKQRELAMGKNAAAKAKAIKGKKPSSTKGKKIGRESGSIRPPQLRNKDDVMSDSEKARLRESIGGELEMDVIEAVTVSPDGTSTSTGNHNINDDDEDDDDLDFLDFDDLDSTAHSNAGGAGAGAGFNDDEIIVGGLVRPKTLKERGPSSAKDLGFNVPDGYDEDE